MESTLRPHFYHGPMIMKRRLYGIQAADGESAQQSCGCISACLIPYSARVACSLLIFVVGRAPPKACRTILSEKRGIAKNAWVVRVQNPRKVCVFAVKPRTAQALAPAGGIFPDFILFDLIRQTPSSKIQRVAKKARIKAYGKTCSAAPEGRPAEKSALSARIQRTNTRPGTPKAPASRSRRLQKGPYGA